MSRPALATCDDLLRNTRRRWAFQERWFAGNRHAEIDVTLGKLAHAADGAAAPYNTGCSTTDPPWLPANRRPARRPRYQPPWKEDLSILWSFEVVAAK